MRKLTKPIITLALLALSVSLVPATDMTTKAYSLVFDPEAYTVQSATFDGKTFTYRAYEGIVYAQYPVDSKYESLNFYARTEFYDGKPVGGYSSDTAPIWFPNTIGGYMPGAADKPGAGRDGNPNSLVQALARGLVVATPGARGRSLKDSKGNYYGKAPAVIIDLKAAVRYLRFNDKLMPGNAERIVSNGTSAGGAVSALLGAAGNNADFAPYLKAIGAADARDDIFAVSAYCPITNLDNADAAYEWLLGGITQTKALPAIPMPAPGMPAEGAAPGGDMAESAPVPGGANPWGAPDSSSGVLSAAQMKLSAQLAAQFPAYLNRLKLKATDGRALLLDTKGSGSFKDYLKSLAIASAQVALESGTDFFPYPWVTIQNGVVMDLDWGQFIAFMGRKKSVPAFDGLEARSGENNLFGTEHDDNLHFTSFGAAHTAVKAGIADPKIVRMMNPMQYIGTRGTTTSAFWRIRHGTVDSDTSIAIPAILAVWLSNRGYSVDFALRWNVPHSGDYDLSENFDWIESISK